MHITRQERSRKAQAGPRELHRTRHGRRMLVTVLVAMILAVALGGAGTVTEPSRAAAATSSAWITVLCKYADVSAEPKTPSYFDTLMGGAYPGMDHFWRQVSYDTFNLTGSRTTSRWFTLPHPRSTYEPADAARIDQLLRDCTAAANAEVDYTRFYGINVMVNADPAGGRLAKGQQRYVTLDNVTRQWGVTWLSPDAFGQQTVVAHEMGHAYGLSHSATAAFAGTGTGNRWDLMSSPACTFDATFNCAGPHPIAYHKWLKGWLPPARVFTPITNLGTWRITIDDLARQNASNFQMARIPITGAPNRSFTVEARLAQGDYEQGLGSPAAVIVHEIDSTRADPAWVIDSDNDGDTLDVFARLTAGESFSGAGNITVRVVSRLATGFEVEIDVRVPPDRLRAGTVGVNSIQLRWGEQTVGEAYYELQQKETRTTTWTSRRVPLNSDRFLVNGLFELTSYDFRLRACDAVGLCSAWSAATISTHAHGCPPSYCF
jgi:M6 family metalloprotease-like protein